MGNENSFNLVNFFISKAYIIKPTYNFSDNKQWLLFISCSDVVTFAFELIVTN